MDLSIVVCAYDMQRELPRTAFTLGSKFQRDIEGLNYEIIVVDNGSPQRVLEEDLQQYAPNLQVVRIDAASPSPASAINKAMQDARGEVLGLFIDGARMASPRLIREAMDAYRIDSNKIIGSFAFHLGPEVQMRSVAAGYNQAAEDKLLASVPWRDDGYALFSISVLAGSSRQGWFGNIAESNGVFMDRTLWNRLGGLDERFTSPGGGMVNLDFWKRAVEASSAKPWMILGEGTFHQVHGGAATGSDEGARQGMFDEYEAIRGSAFEMPSYHPRLIGTLDTALALQFGKIS